MEPRTRWSFRKRLAALIILLVLPVTILMVYSASEQRRIAAAEAERNALALIRPASAEYERAIEGARQLLMVLARLPEVRGRDVAVSRNLFIDLVAQSPLYANVAAANLDGGVFASAVPAAPGTNVGDRAYFRRAIANGDFSVGDYQVGRITGRASVNLAYPVRDRNGAIDGVVFVAIDLNALQRFARELDLPSGSVVVLVDRWGTVLLRQPASVGWIGKSIKDTPLEAALHRSRAGVDRIRDRDGIDRLYAVAPLGRPGAAPGAFLAIGIPRVAAFAQTNLVLLRNIVILWIIGALAMAAAWFIGELKVLRQVQAIVDTTSQVSHGDLKVRTGLQHGADELGRLAEAVDEMAGSLEHLRTQTDMILAAAGEGIMGVDTEDRVTFANPTALRVIGWSLEEVVGRRLHELIHYQRADGSKYPLSECPIHSAYTQAESRRVDDDLFWRRDGTCFPVAYVATPLKIGERLLGAVVVFEDVTDRKRAQEDLARAQDQLISAEQEKKVFYQEAIRALTRGKFHLVDPHDLPEEGNLVMNLPLEEPSDEPEFRARLREAAAAAGMARPTVADLTLASGEAAVNAVKHGQRGRGRVYVTDDRVIVRISDEGEGIRAENLAATILLPGFSTKVSLGMGYTLMLQLVDRLWLSTDPFGTTVQLEKWIRPEEHQDPPLELGLLERYRTNAK